ncbi:MAG: hypothetical protein KC620_23795, partial [Myxococcales bacterium]|nr:hypothetical protein [Myxococcales bacterium]
ADSLATHGRGVVIEAKCLNPFAQFRAQQHAWAWMMQLGFTAQLADYLNFARQSWGRGQIGTPPIKIQYFFCDFLPRWAALQMVGALAIGGSAEFFGEPEVRFGPRDRNWTRSPIWYREALGLADAAGTLIENWEGFVPWGQEPGDWLMNLTGPVYDGLSGSE